MQRPRYKKGDEVSHIDNIGLKMRIRNIFHEEGRLVGIETSWFDGEKLKKENFHSHELIPWAISKLGSERVDSYIKNVNDDFEL